MQRLGIYVPTAIRKQFNNGVSLLKIVQGLDNCFGLVRGSEMTLLASVVVGTMVTGAARIELQETAAINFVDTFTFLLLGLTRKDTK